MADQGMEVDGETDTSQQACEMVGSRDGDDKEGGDKSRTERVARNEGAKDNTSAVPEADPIPSKRARFFDLFGLKRQSSEPGPGNRVNLSKLPIEEKRKYYKCREDYITLSEIPTWSEYHKDIPRPKKSQQTQFRVDCELNDKVSLWRGDITRLEIDAIVNAANSSLMGGGGVDGAIHRAAGSGLMAECRRLAGCDTGDAKLTGGHRLPAKYVLHTVGPMNSSSEKLQSCYQCCLELALKHKIRSIAFPCIATGIYGFPNDEAAEIALTITREWLEKHRDKVDRIIFCVFLEVDYKLYCKLLRCVFPVTNPTTQDPLTPVSGVIAEDSTPFKPSMNKSVSAPGSSSKLVKTAEETQSSESGTAQPAPPEQGLAPSGEVVPSAPELPAQSFPDPGIDD